MVVLHGIKILWEKLSNYLSYTFTNNFFSQKPHFHCLNSTRSLGFLRWYTIITTATTYNFNDPSNRIKAGNKIFMYNTLSNFLFHEIHEKSILISQYVTFQAWRCHRTQWKSETFTNQTFMETTCRGRRD